MPAEDSVELRDRGPTRATLAEPTEALALRLDLETALTRLDQTIEIFKARVGKAGETAGPSPRSTRARAEPDAPGSAESTNVPAAMNAASGARMREAEREAREYLDAAKHRADRLLNSMVSAFEHESAQARRAAESMVAERQEWIAHQSDEISRRAHALTAGMDDAERVRAQFDSFVRALSAAADRIAGDHPGPRTSPRFEPSPIAPNRARSPPEDPAGFHRLGGR